MDHLEKVKKVEVIYSNDFNEILVKTPPSLFRVGLIIFLIGMLSVISLGYFFTFDKEVKIPFISLYDTQDQNHTIGFFTKSNIDNLLKSQDVLKLELESQNMLSSENKKLNVNYSSFSKTKEAFLNGTKLENLESVLENNSNIGGIKFRYKYTIKLNKAEISQIPLEASKGILYLNVGKERLYKVLL